MEDIAKTTSKWQLVGCKAKGLPICEPESSSTKEVIPPYEKKEKPAPAKTLLCDCVFENESLTVDDDSEESFKEPPTNDDEMQLEDIRAEMEDWKQWIELIDKNNELNTPECPVLDPTVDLEVELNENSVHPEILKLQRNNHKLQQQLNELKQCCTASDQALRSLKIGLCRDMDMVSKLQQRIDQMDSFKRNLEHERVMCSQRYRYLMRELYDYDDCHRYIEQKLKKSEKELKRFVAIAEYKNPKHEAIDKLNQSKLHIRDVHNEMITELDGLRNQTRSLPNLRKDSEISAFLQRNMQLFSKETH